MSEGWLEHYSGPRFYIIGLTVRAAFNSPPLAVGSIASIFGVDLAGAVKLADNGLQLPTALRIPWEASSQKTLDVSVTTAGGTSLMRSFPLAPFAPGIFSMDSTAVAKGLC